MSKCRVWYIELDDGRVLDFWDSYVNEKESPFAQENIFKPDDNGNYSLDVNWNKDVSDFPHSDQDEGFRLISSSSIIRVFSQVEPVKEPTYEECSIYEYNCSH